MNGDEWATRYQAAQRVPDYQPVPGEPWDRAAEFPNWNGPWLIETMRLTLTDANGQDHVYLTRQVPDPACACDHRGTCRICRGRQREDIHTLQDEDREHRLDLLRGVY